MEKKHSVKIRLVVTLVICTLFVMTIFSGAAIPPHQEISIDGEPKDVPVNVRDHDWDYWSNPANIFMIPTGNVGIGTIHPIAKLQVSDGAVLFNGTVGGTLISGSGTRLMWIPNKGAFRAGSVSGTQWDAANIGSFSIAMGYSTKASGWGSTAIGYGTIAGGEDSTAMGVETTASGDFSTAMGVGTTAGGEGSTAMGISTTASGDYSTAMGQSIRVNGYNSLGIGLSYRYSNWFVNSSNVLSIMGGNVGIGTGSPSAMLHVENGAVLLSGTNGVTPTSGSGTRLMWIPSKGAFRAGFVSGSQWDATNIGMYSMAMGYSTKASGGFSIAIGYGTTASGEGSTAMGDSTNAWGISSTALGDSTNANGLRSTALGYLTTASGNYSTALGDWTTASGLLSTSMGYGTIANGTKSTAMGDMTIASGDHSTAMGCGTKAGGDYSTTMGNGTIANGYQSTAMGYSTQANGVRSTALGQTITVNGQNSLGIGLNYHAPNWVVNTSYVMAIMGGNVGIGTTNPLYSLDVQGYTQAYGYYTGDIIFQKDGKQLWRMYEDEKGLYVQSLLTGKTYRFVLQEINTNESDVTQAIKNLQDENQLLKERLEALERAVGVQ